MEPAISLIRSLPCLTSLFVINVWCKLTAAIYQQFPLPSSQRDRNYICLTISQLSICYWTVKWDDSTSQFFSSSQCIYITSCAPGDTICPRPSPPPVVALAPCAPPSRRNVAVLSHTEYIPTLTAAANLHVKAALSKLAWWPWPFTCDLGYLCVNFGLARPLCSRVTPNVCNRQTSDKSIA